MVNLTAFLQVSNTSMWVVSRLSSNKQVLSEVVRGLKAEDKVCLMFLQEKQQENMYARCLQMLETNK